MKAPVFGLDGEVKKNVRLPKVFETPFRPDLINRVFWAMFTHSLQPKGTDPLAGERTSARSWGVGHGVSRIARVKGERHPRAGMAAGVAGVVKGRAAHPPKAEKVIYLQHVRPLFDCLGCCRLQWVETGLSLEYYAKVFEAATGVKMSVEELLKGSERIFNLTRAINARRGLTGREDRLPDRAFEEPVPNGVVKGFKLDKEKFNELLKAYYELRGWDPETGLPTRAKLEELGLKDVADALGL